MKEIIDPQEIGKPVGAYCHGWKFASKQLIIVGGQVPVDKDGNLVGVPKDKLGLHQTIDLAAQVRQTLLNVKAVVEAAGGSVKDIVRLEYYVVISAMNEYRSIGHKIRAEVMPGVLSAGYVVAVAGLMIPNALIEIAATAAID